MCYKFMSVVCVASAECHTFNKYYFFLRCGKNAIIYNILGFIVNDVNKFFVKHLRFSLQIQGSGKGC